MSRQECTKAYTIPLVKPDLPPLEAVEDSFRAILANGRITNFSPSMLRFEEEVSAYLGGLHAAATSSGTIGLVLALGARGLQPGQKVIIPSFIFMAAAQAVYYARGIPVFADIDDDLTLAPSDLAVLLEHHDNVGAVLPVHTYGLPCQVDAMQQVVDAAAHRSSRPIVVLYDAAHAFGSAIGPRRVGTFGNAEVFSCSATKMLVSVEGGLVVSRDAQMIERIRKMRNYGIGPNYDAHFSGLNGKMSEFHAIIGLYNLARIETRAYFSPPLHRQQFFQQYADRPLPRTDALAERVLTLPFYASITNEELAYVVNALGEVEQSLSA